MRVQRVLLIAVCCVLAAGAVFAGSKPIAVSPGDTSKLVLIGDSCPTFSWGQVDGARGYELVVYRLGEEGEDGEEAMPVLRQRISGSALGWTPSLNRCLAKGGRYAWSVRAVGEKAASDWSAPSLFQVAAGPSQAEFEIALQVVRSYLDRGAGAGSESEVADEAQAEVEPEASPSSPTPAAPAGTELSVEGNVDAGSFSGTGALLTDLDPANLSPGTAAIDITGNAATATVATDLVGSQCVSTAELAFDPATEEELDSHRSLTVPHPNLRVGASELLAMHRVVVECNGECDDELFEEICPSGARPISVRCDEQLNLNYVDCGPSGDGQCDRDSLPLWPGGLGSYCKDGSGSDAVVHCIGSN